MSQIAGSDIVQAYPGAGLSVPRGNRAVVSTVLDIWTGAFGTYRKIGFCQSVNLTDARGVNVIRHLDKEAAGRIVETVPQIENITGSITSVEIYNNVFPARLIGGALPTRINTGHQANQSLSLGGAVLFMSLQSQRIPFDMFEWYVHPGDDTKQILWAYLDCMMTNYTKTVNLGNTTFTSTVNLLIPHMTLAGGAGVGQQLGLVNSNSFV